MSIAPNSPNSPNTQVTPATSTALPVLVKTVWDMLKGVRLSRDSNLAMWLDVRPASDRWMTVGFSYNSKFVGEKAFLVRALDPDSKNQVSFVILDTGLPYQVEIFNNTLAVAKAAAKVGNLKVTSKRNFIIPTR